MIRQYLSNKNESATVSKFKKFLIKQCLWRVPQTAAAASPCWQCARLGQHAPGFVPPISPLAIALAPQPNTEEDCHALEPSASSMVEKSCAQAPAVLDLVPLQSARPRWITAVQHGPAACSSSACSLPDWNCWTDAIATHKQSLPLLLATLSRSMAVACGSAPKPRDVVDQQASPTVDEKALLAACHVMCRHWQATMRADSSKGKSSFLIAAYLLNHLFDYFLCLNTLIIGVKSSRA
jgi:hypothetical protein